MVVGVQNESNKGLWYYELIAEAASFSKISQKVRFKSQPVLH